MLLLYRTEVATFPGVPKKPNLLLRELPQKSLGPECYSYYQYRVFASCLITLEFRLFDARVLPCIVGTFFKFFYSTKSIQLKLLEDSLDFLFEISFFLPTFKRLLKLSLSIDKSII